MEKHGWSRYFKVDIMDADEDMVLEIPNGRQIKKNYLGSHMADYDSMLVLSHFKGHPMGGYGGALKQLSIGCASAFGKAYIHGAGNPDKLWSTEQDLFLEAMADAASSVADYFKGRLAYINVMCNLSVDCDCCADKLWSTEQDLFLEAMADAASSVADYFKGRLAYINVMCNLSVDCDCCAVAEDPCMKDIGILAGLDPVALDQACIDLIYQSDDPGRAHFIERVESRNGIHTIEAAEALGIGSRAYRLIEL